MTMTGTLTDPSAPSDQRRRKPVGRARDSRIQKMLKSCLVSVTEGQVSDVARLLDGHRAVDSLPSGERFMALQALGTWHQLLAIAREFEAVQMRREIERAGQASDIPGSFAEVISRAASGGKTQELVSEALRKLCVTPTMTAHPTETKRVTVLETHRRIYRRLTDLLGRNWAPREQEALSAGAHGRDRDPLADRRIAAEKPTVAQEVPGGSISSTRCSTLPLPALHETLDHALAPFLRGVVRLRHS